MITQRTEVVQKGGQGYQLNYNKVLNTFLILVSYSVDTIIKQINCLYWLEEYSGEIDLFLLVLYYKVFDINGSYLRQHSQPLRSSCYSLFYENFILLNMNNRKLNPILIK